MAATTAMATLAPSSLATPSKYIEVGTYDPMATKLENSIASNTSPLIRLTNVATAITLLATKVPMSSAGTDQRRKYHNHASSSKVVGVGFSNADAVATTLNLPNTQVAERASMTAIGILRCVTTSTGVMCEYQCSTQ